MKVMKFWLVLVAVGMAAFPSWAADAKVEVVEEIIAKVNGAIITRTDLEHSRALLLAELKRRKTPKSEIAKRLKEEEQNFLRDKIDELLLIQKGKDLNINVDKDVSKYFADLMLQFKVSDQEKFAQLVREQTGSRFEDYKEEVKNGILTQRVLGQEVGSRISVPKEEIEKYYNEHKKEFIREERVFLSEILLSTDGKKGADLAAVEKKAKNLVVRARRGEKFDELAKQYSDAVTAKNGGDLGGWKKGDLRADIEAQIWDKEKNYVTDPIKTANGFLILKVIAHPKAGLAMLEEVENEIRSKLAAPLFQPKIREYLTTLRQQAFLEIKPGYVDLGAAPGKDTSWSDPAKLTPETVTKQEVVLRPGHKKLLWLFPIPGTKVSEKSTSK